MRIAVTGATGMLGRALLPFLTRRGHTTVPISRRPVADGLVWDPRRHTIDTDALEGIDAVVHLAGENIAGKRWTAERKQVLRESRVGPTAFLASTIAGLTHKPRVLVSASAVGIYGEHGDDIVDESTPPASDFLGQLAVAWEGAADPARAAGVRVVHPRFATILSPTGGALEKMLPPFRLGLGGPLAGGHHWTHWVAIDDVVAAILFLIEQDSLHGAFNVVAPGIVRNAEFTLALAHAIHRPAVVPVPRVALRLLFGELTDAALLTSIRVVPRRLEAAGFAFQFASIGPALKHVLGGRAGR